MEKRGIVEKGLTPCDHVCCCHPADKVDTKTKHACCNRHKKKDGVKQSSADTQRLTTFTEPID